MRNHANENELDLHESGLAGKTDFHTKTRFETEVKCGEGLLQIALVVYLKMA